MDTLNVKDVNGWFRSSGMKREKVFLEGFLSFFYYYLLLDISVEMICADNG